MLLEIAVIARGELARRVVRDARRTRRVFRGRGGGSTSGQFLVRMVWSGVTTPAWLVRAKSFETDEIEHRIGRCGIRAPDGARRPRLSGSLSLHAPRTIGATAPPSAVDVPRRRDCRLAAARDKFLGARDHFDRRLIGFARTLAVGDDAVFSRE